MHNTHVQVDRDPDPFSFNARVNDLDPCGIAIPYFLFRVNRV